MYVWLKLIFAKSETFRDIKIVISPFVHFLQICISTKFGGSSSRNKPATPLRSLKWFWREIHFECSKDLQIWWKVGFLWDLKMVKFWLWYLKPILNNPRLTDFLVPRCPQTGKKYSFFYLIGGTHEPENQSVLDCSGLVWDVTTKVSDEGVNIASVITQEHSDGSVTMDLTIHANGVLQLNNLFTVIRSIVGVEDVTRIHFQKDSP